MATEKTFIQAKAGVRFERIEQLTAQGKIIQQQFKISTLRPNQPRILADHLEAETDFDLEVIASPVDTVVVRLTS